MNSAAYWIKKGVELKRQGKFQEAILAYQEALPLAHNDEIIETYKAMGKAYFLLDDTTNAINYYVYALNASIGIRIANEQFSVDTENDKLDILNQYFDTLIHVGHALVAHSDDLLMRFAIQLYGMLMPEIRNCNILDFKKYLENELMDYKVRLSGGVLSHPIGFNHHLRNPIPQSYDFNQLYMSYACTIVINLVNWDLINQVKQEGV